MSDPNGPSKAEQTDGPKAAKETAKAAKKAAKAAAKAAKKGGLAPAGPAAPASPPHHVEQPAAPPPEGMSPAERSALAAERNVALQRRRVIISAIGVALALVTALITWLSFRASVERPPKAGQGTVETRPTDPQPPAANTDEEAQQSGETGDLVEDGLYQGVIFKVGTLTNLYDKSPSPADDSADRPFDVDMDGVPEFTPVEASPGMFTHDGGDITFH